MIEFRALVARCLARLVSQRTVLIALIVAFGVLAASGASAVAVVLVKGETELEQAASLRALLWTRASILFEQLLFLLAVAWGATQIRGDLRDGSLFCILARPVSRPMVYVAAWLAPALLLGSLELVRSVTWIAVAGTAIDARLVLGVAGLVGRHWLLLALCATLGVRLKTAYAVGLGIGVLLLGQLAFRADFRGASRWLIDGLGMLVPLYRRQDVLLRALVGEEVPLAALAEAATYQFAWAGALVCIGVFLFGRQDLAPP